MEEVDLVRILSTVGVRIESVWDLVGAKGRYDAALPVLAAALPKLTDPKVKEAVVRALTVRGAPEPVLAELVREFRNSPPEPMGLGWIVGNAISEVAAVGDVDTLLDLATAKEFGANRQMIVSGLGRFEDRRIPTTLVTLLEDADVAAHAAEALGHGVASEDVVGALQRQQRFGLTALVRREAAASLTRLVRR